MLSKFDADCDCIHLQHYLSTNCLYLQENATINFCPLKVRSRAMGKIMPSDIYHFYPLVLNLLSRNLTVNRLSVTDDWNMEKMDGHLKRNVKKYDIQECLTLFIYRQCFSLIQDHSAWNSYQFCKITSQYFMELSQCYDLSRILLSWC